MRFELKKLTIILLILLVNSTFSQIKFESDFESGNLKSVTAIDSVNFQIITETDPGIDGGSSRWFYFKIMGVKEKEVTVSFINSDVTKAMYSYDNVNFDRFSDDEVPTSGQFRKNFQEDTVYISYYTPYNYSYLQSRIEEWNVNPYVSVDTLGISPQGLPIQELKVTDNTIPDSLKKSVWIHARTHPSETPSSWHFDGIMQELLKGNEVINSYLKDIVFYMIPFTNPDGVYYGRSRVNYEGINIESNWDKIESLTSVEVKILRERMKELNDEKPFSVFLNLHSQASSYCTFWIHTASSTSTPFYTREYQFSYLNLSDNPYFVKDDLLESNLRSVFPEAWLWDNYGAEVMALTYETPYNSYFRSGDQPFIEVTNENLFEIGRRTLYSIAEYLEVSHPHHYIMDNSNAAVSGDYTNYSTGLEYYSNDFTVLPAGDTTNFILFNSEDLPSGMYDVSAWWPTSSGNSFETVFEIFAGSNNYKDTKTQKINGGQWNYLTSVELNNEGPISIKVKGNSTGLVVGDAFRLIYSGPVTGLEKEKIPSEFVLYQNYPNPFNPSTKIKYSISADNTYRNVKLVIFNMLGEKMITLVDQEQYPGEYEVTFNASSFGQRLASGPYFYRLQVGDYIETKKMILMK